MEAALGPLLTFSGHIWAHQRLPAMAWGVLRETLESCRGTVHSIPFWGLEIHPTSELCNMKCRHQKTFESSELDTQVILSCHLVPRLLGPQLPLCSPHQSLGGRDGRDVQALRP